LQLNAFVLYSARFYTEWI